MSSTQLEFQHGTDFHAGQVAGAVTLGPLEAQYQELFSEALADGVITEQERAKLERAAENLGLDRVRLGKLEQAMVAAYETHHRVQVIERWEEPAASLAPLQVSAQGDAGRTLLLKRIEQLETRIKDLEVELREAQANVNVEVDLGEFNAPKDAEDVPELLRQIRRNPLRPEPYHQLFQLHGQAAQTDRQYWVAQALVALSAATPTEAALAERYRRTSLIAPKSSITASAWTDLVYHHEEEPLTGLIFGVLAPAVLLGRVTTLRRMGKLIEPKPEQRQDPTQATLTAVRAVPWAAAILGLAVPPIYVDKAREHGYLLTPGVPPHTRIGKAALSGVSQLACAFNVARHLTQYRQERFIKQLYEAVTDLEDIFLAALLIGSPGLPIAEDTRRRVAPVAQAIEPMLEPAQVDALRGYFMRFVADGGRTNLQRWSQAVEKTAARAALCLTGDLATALAVLEREEGRFGELAKDLLFYAVSDEYARLRRQLGIELEA